jgi:predicted flap endonuclease-1-like 5' DNA nuclease
MSIPCIIIPAIVGVICGILGYLMGRMAWNGSEGGKASTLKAELDACHSKTKHLSEKIESLEGALSVSKSSAASSSASTKPASPAADKSPSKAAKTLFDAAAAKAAIGKKVVQDDLKIIEGIGPKIADLFIAAGIKTWKDLSETSLEKAQSILKAAGDRYAIHNPGTWSRQAKMMNEGKWGELKAWQVTLDSGKE